MCLFENVCWMDDHFEIFEDPALKAATPEFMWPDAFGDAMLSLGHIPHFWAPESRAGPAPKGASWIGNETFLLNANSHSDNFGHVLFDDLIPALTALALLDLPLDNGRLLSQYGCRRPMPSYDPDGDNPYVHRPRKDVCLENFALYTPLVLGRPMVDLEREWKGQTVCMKRLVASHSSVFSLRSLDVQRGTSLRHARDFIVEKLGLTAMNRPAFHDVMVLVKKPGFLGPPTSPTLCEDTKRLLQDIDHRIPVRCFDPVSQTINEQVNESLKSSLIVAEHGTISYAALYGHTGVVLLSMATRDVVKEVQVNLYATHYDTYYFAVEDMESQYEGMLRFGLAKAAANFGFESTCIGMCVT